MKTISLTNKKQEIYDAYLSIKDRISEKEMEIMDLTTEVAKLQGQVDACCETIKSINVDDDEYRAIVKERDDLLVVVEDYKGDVKLRNELFNKLQKEKETLEKAYHQQSGEYAELKKYVDVHRIDCVDKLSPLAYGSPIWWSIAAAVVGIIAIIALSFVK